MLPEKNILPFIPQRAPFVMIGELVACDGAGAKTTLLIDKDNIFVREGILQEVALVENMAQTAAVRIGYICQQEKKPVPIGYIAAVQKLVIYDLPKKGDMLETEITIKNQVLHVTIISGKVKVNDRAMAECEMKIFVQTIS